MARFDTVVAGGDLVIPYVGTVRADLGIRDGRIAAIEDVIPATDGKQAIDARGRVVAPGAVDAHFHIGIYRPIEEDAESETRSSLVGGVTSVISYFRTGSHYLNRSGSYREILPEVIERTSGHAYTDFAYHIGIMEDAQLDEIDWLVEQGIGSFKFFMFYKGLNLEGSSTDGSALTMSENYDLGHLYRYMLRVQAAAARHAQAGRISLSLHCEQSELLRVFIEEVQAKGIDGLEGYHLARPPLTERLAISEAGVLIEATKCPVNFLHLSSALAFQTADEFRRSHPEADLRLETTLHHLSLTWQTAAGGLQGKVNPPIREQADNDALWAAVMDGRIDHVVSDHACCFEEDKADLWGAKAGFGGTALLYPVLISDGYHKRGLPLHRVAELVSASPAQTFGLYPRKGTIAVGSDADLAIIDLEKEQPITTDVLLAAQDFTPFEGYPVKGWPVMTIRRGELMYRDGEVVGGTTGEFLRRPQALHAAQPAPTPATGVR